MCGSLMDPQLNVFFLRIGLETLDWAKIKPSHNKGMLLGVTLTKK